MISGSGDFPFRELVTCYCLTDVLVPIVATSRLLTKLAFSDRTYHLAWSWVKTHLSKSPSRRASSVVWTSSHHLTVTVFVSGTKVSARYPRVAFVHIGGRRLYSFALLILFPILLAFLLLLRSTLMPLLTDLDCESVVSRVVHNALAAFVADRD